MSISNLQGILNSTGGVGLSLPYFRAVKASDSIPTATNDVITAYDSVSGSMASAFVPASGLFTPPKDGYYQITVKYFFSAGAPSAGVNIPTIAAAGGTIVINSPESGYVGGSVLPTLSGAVWLSSSTYYYLSVYQTVANPLAISQIEFSAFLVAV